MKFVVKNLSQNSQNTSKFMNICETRLSALVGSNENEEVGLLTLFGSNKILPELYKWKITKKKPTFAWKALFFTHFMYRGSLVGIQL